MKTTISVIDMVRKGIKENGADGLYNESDGCGCGLDDLQPCGAIMDDCEIAKKAVVTQDDIDNDEYSFAGDYDLRVGDEVFRPIMVEREDD